MEMQPASGISRDIIPKLLEERGALIGVGSRFIAKNVSVAGYPSTDLTFFPIVEDTPAIAFPYTLSLVRDLQFMGDGGLALFGERSAELAFTRIHMFDIAAKKDKVLLEDSDHHSQGVIVERSTLFIAFGRSLMAMDVESGDILDWADLFLDGPIKAHDSPVRIKRLLIDDAKLVVLADNGSTRIIDPQRVRRLARSKGNPFTTTRHALFDQ